MNNYYNIDSFEQFLRDKTKDFKMMPKKRVWFSIYNNIHPSKSLPSAVTSLFLLFIFFIIDFLNTGNHFVSSSKKKIYHANNSGLLFYNTASKNNQSLSDLTNITVKKTENQIKIRKNKIYKSISDVNELKFEACEEIKINSQNNVSPNFSIINNEKYLNKKNLNPIDKLNFNKKSNSNNLSYEIYASPSFTYGDVRNVDDFFKNDEISEQSKSNLRNFQYSDLNFYAGGAILYNINSSIKIKAGLELRYSKSSIFNSFNENNKQFNTKNSENTGFDFLYDNQKTLLELNSYNISIPIGSEFELAGNDRIHWYAGASLEPTFRIYNNSNLNETTDLQIHDAINSRKWNINSNLETFLSLRINKNSFFNAGPQFRYQLFTRYNNLNNPYYNSYNFGMKFGISKTF